VHASLRETEILECRVQTLNQNRVLYEWPTAFRTENQSILINVAFQRANGILALFVGQNNRAIRCNVLAWTNLPEPIHGFIDPDGAAIKVDVIAAQCEQFTDREPGSGCEQEQS
jgi:hypothetical protein